MLSTGVSDPFTGPKGVRLLLVCRGFFGFFGLFGIYFSLQFLSLSDATVITFLAPLLTAFSGAFFLGEKFSRREVFAGFFSLVGVVLIARPPFLFGSGGEGGPELPSTGDAPPGFPSREVTPEQRLIAVGVGLLGVFGSTGAYTTLRAIGKRAHPLHSLVSFSLQSILVATIGLIVTKTEFIVPTRLAWLAMLVMIGIFGFCAQVLLTMGLARETASRGSMAIYTQIVFAMIFERIFFQAIPSVLSVIGTLTILSCALYVALTKESSSGADKGDKNTITLRNIEDDSMERGLLGRDSQDNEHQKEQEGEDQDCRGKERSERPTDNEPVKDDRSSVIPN